MKENFIKYPCEDCENDILYPIPGYPTLCECSKCGHPQDIPSEIDLEHYDASL